MAAGYWQISALDAAGQAVPLGRLASSSAADDEATVVDLLRELVKLDRAPDTLAVGQVVVQRLGRGYVAGSDPTYWAQLNN
jgi:hypothetical protein